MLTVCCNDEEEKNESVTQSHVYDSFHAMKSAQHASIEEEDYDVVDRTRNMSIISHEEGYSSFHEVRQLSLDSSGSKDDSQDFYDELKSGVKISRPQTLQNYDKVSLDGLEGHQVVVLENKENNFQKIKRRPSTDDVWLKDSISSLKTTTSSTPDEYVIKTNTLSINSNILQETSDTRVIDYVEEDEYTFCEIDDDDDNISAKDSECLYEECHLDDDVCVSENNSDQEVNGKNDKEQDDLYDVMSSETESCNKEDFDYDYALKEKQEKTVSNSITSDHELINKNNSSKDYNPRTSRNAFTKEAAKKKTNERRKHDYEEYKLN